MTFVSLRLNRRQADGYIMRSQRTVTYRPIIF